MISLISWKLLTIKRSCIQTLFVEDQHCETLGRASTLLPLQHEGDLYQVIDLVYSLRNISIWESKGFDSSFHVDAYISRISFMKVFVKLRRIESSQIHIVFEQQGRQIVKTPSFVKVPRKSLPPLSCFSTVEKSFEVSWNFLHLCMHHIIVQNSYIHQLVAIKPVQRLSMIIAIQTKGSLFSLSWCSVDVCLAVLFPICSDFRWWRHHN